MGWNEAAEKFEQDAKYTWRNPGFAQTDEHPVVNVSWNDAVAFCEWLSKQEGKRYRLPTEAEWEYACRAGSTTRFSNGDDPERPGDVGNVADGTAKAKYPKWNGTITARDGYVYTAPVGTFRPNGFGLYDMHGNVWEWCSDWYDQSYYANSPVEDPQGPATGSDRVVRGGGWFGSPVTCRSAIRPGFNPSSVQLPRLPRYLRSFRLMDLKPSIQENKRRPVGSARSGDRRYRNDPGSTEQTRDRRWGLGASADTRDCAVCFPAQPIFRRSSLILHNRMRENRWESI